MWCFIDIVDYCVALVVLHRPLRSLCCTCFIDILDSCVAHVVFHRPFRLLCCTCFTDILGSCVARGASQKSWDCYVAHVTFHGHLG